MVDTEYVFLTYVICQFGNVCTIEADGMCPECVEHFKLFPDYGE